MLWLSSFTERKLNTNDYFRLLRAEICVLTVDLFNKPAFIFPPSSHVAIFTMRDVMQGVLLCYVVSRLTSFVLTYYLVLLAQS